MNGEISNDANNNNNQLSTTAAGVQRRLVTTIFHLIHHFPDQKCGFQRNPPLQHRRIVLLCSQIPPGMRLRLVHLTKSGFVAIRHQDVHFGTQLLDFCQNNCTDLFSKQKLFVLI